ncbi:S1C family serine protease [Streptomyces sp. NPDC050560]|uniref:S1C family serine protease n=1 Tax=Streptomyces sp. NPDC050560 TaxID=3365630 RepID=UPI00378E6A99
MDESIRRGGEYPEYPGESERQSAYPHGGPRHPYGQEAPAPQGATDHPDTTGHPNTTAPGGPTGPDGTYASFAAAPAPPAHAPTVHQHHRRRMRGPLGLLAAVAIAAAAVGGASAYGVQQLTGSHDGGTSTVSGTTVSAGSKGTVAGVAQAASPAIVEITSTSASGESLGSGVVITKSGQVVTNNHVVTGASTIKVRTSDGKTYTARTLGTDPDKDLALIQLEGASGLKPATLGDSDALRVGDDVVAIGSPEGLSGTVTSGIVSALNRDVTVPVDDDQSQGSGQNGQGSDGQEWPFRFGGQQFNGDTGSSTTTYKAIQTDASLNHGNSGGALLNMEGQVVGISSAMYSGDQSSSDSGSVGLGFAIPINVVKADLDHLRG